MPLLEVFEQKFQEALLDHERRVLLDMLAQHLATMTFADLNEVLNSPLGQRLGPMKVSALLSRSGAADEEEAPHRGRGRPKIDAEYEARLDAAILEVLYAVTEPISRDEIGRRLGDHRGVLPALRRLTAKGAIASNGGPIFFKYTAVNPAAAVVPTEPRRTGEVPPDLEVQIKILLELQTERAGMSPAALRANIKTDISQALKTLMEQKVIKRQGVGRATRYVIGSPERVSAFLAKVGLADPGRGP